MADKDIELGITYNAAKGLSEIEKTEKALGGLDKAAKKTQESFDKTGKSAKEASSGFSSLVQSASGLAGVAAAAGALSGAILGTATAGVQAFMSWETAFAGVKKTVEATDVEFDKLEGQLRDMAKQSPLTANEIAGVAEAAGALGIATKDVAAFTKTMTTLGATTDLSAGSAADQIARLNNIMQDAPDAGKWENFGSALVYLGNSSAATESQIVSMATRIAGAGSQANLTQANVLGISAALSSVGLAAESGGTAISRLIIQMQNSVDTGDKFLKVFDEMYQASGKMVAGAKTFGEAWKKDAAGALGVFFEGLKKSDTQGRSTIKVLQELGVSSVRMQDTVMRAAEASKLFNKSLQDANESFKNGQKANEEFAKRVATLESQFAILRNRVRDAWVSIGEAFRPVVATFVAGLNTIALGATNLAKGFAALPAPIHWAIAALGLFAAAVASVAGAMAAWRAAGSVIPIVLESIAKTSPRAAEALQQFAMAGKLDLSKAKDALKGFADALSFKGAKLVGRDEFKALDQGALTLGRFTMNLKVMTVEAIKAGSSATWGWLKTLPGMFSSAASGAASALKPLTESLTKLSTIGLGKGGGIAQLPVLMGIGGGAAAAGAGLAIGKLADSILDAAEASENLKIRQEATAVAMSKTSTEAEKQAAQMKLVRVNLEEATAKIGLFEGGMVLAGDAADKALGPLDRLSAWLDKKIGPGPWSDLRAEILKLTGLAVVSRDEMEKLGNMIYGMGDDAAHTEARARDLAAASKLAGEAITDWGKAQKIIADDAAVRNYWANETAAIKKMEEQAATSLAKATAHLESYKKHLAETRFEELTKGMTEEQKKGFKGVPIQDLLDAYDAAQSKAPDAAEAAKKFTSAVEEQGKKAKETAAEVVKFATSMKGFVATEEITKMQGALAKLGGASKLSEEAVLKHGAAFAEAAKKGQVFTGELANLVTRYNEVAQAGLRASMAGRMDPAAIKSYREWAAALESVGAANIPTDQIEAFARRIQEAQANGEKLGTEAQKVVSAWVRMQEAEAAMVSFNKAIEQATALTSQLEAAAKIEDTLAEQAAAVTVAINNALTAAGGSILGGFEKVNDLVLKQTFAMLQQLGQQYAAAGLALPDLLYSRLIAVGNELKTRGLSEVYEGASSKLPEIASKTDDATRATFDWNAALENTANIMQVLGVDSQSTFGKIVGGIQGVMGALENLKGFASKDGKGGLLGGLTGLFGAEGLGAKGAGALGKRWAAGGAIGGVLGAASSLFGGQSSTAGRALGGAAMGAQLGSVAGPWGMAAGAVVGAVVGAFKKPSWVKVGKDAGKTLGMKVSEELAKSIEQTKKQLKVSTAAAALLHLDEAVAESGKSWKEFGTQVQDLWKGIADGTVPVKEGMEQIEKAWGGIREEAEKAGRVGDKMTRDMIAQAKAQGRLTAEMKDFLKERGAMAAQAAAGLGGLFGFKRDEDGKLNFKEMLDGYTAMTEEQGRALGSVFIAAFETAVGELGVLEATDQMREGFAEVREGMVAMFGEDFAAQLFAPIAGMFDLTAPDSPFRGAAQAGDSLNKIFTAVADTGRLTAANFKDFGTTAMTAFNQAKAAGADQATAIQTILPYLQSAVSAAKEYGYELDENTQALVDQAKAAGYAFPTDPALRTATAVEKLVEALNKAFNLGMDLGDAFGRVATNATAAANAAGQIPSEVPTGRPTGVPSEEPLLNEGGIVNAPLSGMRAILHGPEAVIPLEKLSNLLAPLVAPREPVGDRVVNITTTAPLTLNQNPFLAADTQDEANKRIVQTVVEALQRRDAALLDALPKYEPTA